MKRKILVFAPILAMAVAGCFPRIPVPTTSSSGTSKTTTATTSGTKTSGTGSTGTTTGGSSGTSTAPTPAETYGTLDNPITVARAIEIAAAIPGAASGQTVFETKDAYIKGIVLNTPEESSRTAGTYRFNIGDAYGASQSVQFYWGKIDQGVNLPVQGDEVVAFGRLANYNNGQIYELAYKKDVAADPVIKKSSHVSCTITVQEAEHGSIEGAPASALTGDVITLTATPEANYNVEYVKVNGVEIMSSEDVYKFTVVTDSVISASFVEGPVQHTAMELAYKGAISGSTEEFTFSGVVIATAGKDYYLQDGDYGMLVYNSTAPEGLAVGKEVEVTATVTTYNNIVETKSVKNAVIKGDADLPNAVSVASAEALAALNQNILMDIAGKAIFVSRQDSKGVDNTWTSSADSFVTFTVGQDNIKVKFAKAAYNEEKAALVNAAVAGDEFELSNLVTAVFKTDYQPTFVAESVISKEAVIPSKVTITTEESVVEGGQLALTATIEPQGATDDLVWSLAEGDEAYATIDGEVLKAEHAGKVTLSVALKNYPEVTDSKNITIDEKQKVYVESIVSDPESLSLEVNETGTLSLTILPATGVEEDIAWSVLEGEGVVEIDANHGIKGLKAGEAKVRIEGAESHVGCTVPVAVDYALSTLEEVSAAAVAGSKDTFKFRGVVTSTCGTKDYYIQDGSWGMYVYGSTRPEGLAVGKLVEVVATVKTYNNIIETNSVSKATVIEDGTMPNPVLVSSADELAALHQSVLMNLATGVFVSRKTSAGVDNTWAANADTFVTLTVGQDNIKVKFAKAAYDEEKAAVINAAVAGDKLDLGSLVSAVFKDENQPTFVNESTISKVVVVPTSVEIKLDSTSVIEGSELALNAVIGPEGATDNLVWSLGVGEESLAKIEDGKLKAIAHGTVHLTVALENYPEVTDTVEITIEAKQKVLVESITPTPASLTLAMDEVGEIDIVVLPAEGLEENIVWSVKEGGESVIEITSNHGIKAIGYGNAVVKIEGEESHNGCEVPVSVVRDHGTLDNPISLAAAKEIIDAGDTDEMFITGVVKSNTAWSTKYENIDVYLEFGELTFQLFRATFADSEMITTYGAANAMVGMTVIASGQGTIYNSKYELDQGCVIQKLEAPAAESITVTPSADKVIAGQSVTITTKINPAGATGTVNLALREGDEAYATLSNGTLTGNVAGHTVRVIATLAENPEVTGYADIAIIEPVITGLEFAKESYEIAKGNELDLAKELTITPEGGVGELEWSIDLEGVNVSAAGVVTVSDSAEVDSKATLTVKVKDSDVTATTEIKVIGSAPATETTVETTVVDYANKNGWTNGTQYPTMTLDEVITATAAGGSNTGKYYTSGNQWRLYQGESATLTIAAASGYTIKTITVTYVSNNGGIFTEVASGVELSVEAGNIVLHVSNSGSATNGQARVTAISVTYYAA